MGFGYVGMHRAGPVIYDGVLLAGVPRRRTVHRRKRVSWYVPVIASLAIVLMAALGINTAKAQTVAPAPSQQHVTLTLDAYRTVPRYVRAYRWAWTQVGCWYAYGGAGPCWNGYDCSGLVYRAYQAAGVAYFGRDTYEMLASGRLHLVHRPHPGELAWYSQNHVELYAGNGYTYGARNSGTRVGLHKITAWFHPAWYAYVWGS